MRMNSVDVVNRGKLDRSHVFFYVVYTCMSNGLQLCENAIDAVETFNDMFMNGWVI